MKIEIEPKPKQNKKLIRFLKKKDIKFSIIENELPEIPERKVVDFRIKKTEKGWNEWLDKIAFTNIPKWFEFIGWLFLLGAMSFLAEKTNSIYVRIIYAFSYVFLIILMFRYFLSIDFRSFH